MEMFTELASDFQQSVINQMEVLGDSWNGTVPDFTKPETLRVGWGYGSGIRLFLWQNSRSWPLELK